MKVGIPLLASLPFLINAYPVYETCKSREEVIQREINSKLQNPFYVADIEFVQSQLSLWNEYLPRIAPFYAIKCNPDPQVLSVLAASGTGFDCASLIEIQTILEMNIPPERIVFANPCKPESHIEYARANGVKRMTFDNDYELDKIKRLFPDAELILRILPDDSKAKCQLGSKFGVDIEQVHDLLLHAKDLDLNVMGISFHVGSGCDDVETYRKAVRLAKTAYDLALELGFNIKLLDVGGGFPGSIGSQETFKSIAGALGSEIDLLIPPHVAVISEPGRFFAAGAFTLFTQVTSKRAVQSKGKRSFLYYLNDGVYASFNCLVFDYAEVTPLLLKEKETDDLYEADIYGCSCDSLDVILKNVMLPELDVGEWLAFENMGAYTLSASSMFNGFEKPRVVYSC